MTGVTKSIVMAGEASGSPVEIANVPLTEETVFLKIECDFKNRADLAHFYYSVEKGKWISIGIPLHMAYTLPHFMGYRFALFNFATKTAGGFVDFDYYRINEKLTGTNWDTTAN